MINEGSNSWCDGYSDGFWGKPEASQDPDYLDGYGRGYATSEIQSAIATQNEQWRENELNRKNSRRTQSA